jgi:predicted ribosome quality control (RQC) complex YloA/Tae2 family protein
LLGRKHLRNARVASLRQPRLERLLELDCEQRDASGQLYRVRLIVEAMGRRSNLVLVGDDDSILDAARRSPPARNPRRPILPHLRYEPPPPQDRLLPEQLSPSVLAERAGGGTGGTLAQFLGQVLAGLSPLAGRELTFRSSGSTETPLADADWPSVLAAWSELLGERQPTLARRAAQPIEFAPYALRHLEATGAELQRFASISEALSVYYASERTPVRGDALSGERRALLEALDRQMHTADRRLASLEQQLASSAQNQEPLRRAGELILTYQPSLGSAELGVDGETIALDATLGASDNAQAYFARYRKAREAAQRVPELIAEARNQSAYLAELRTLVQVASDMQAIRALRREAGVERPGRRQASSKSAPYRRIPLDHGWEALVGTSASGNAYVTFDLAGGDDLWLHARGVPGAHVILRGGTGQPPPSMVERAAELAAWHSAAREAGQAEVDVAPRRYVKKVPNAPPGLVRYSHEHTLRVTARA